MEKQLIGTVKEILKAYISLNIKISQKQKNQF